MFGKHLVNLGTLIWDKRNPMTGGKGIAIQHEYIQWLSKDEITISSTTENAKEILSVARDLVKKYNGVNEQVKLEFSNWFRSNNKLTGGDRAYSNIDELGRVYQSVSLRAPEPRTDPKFHKPLIHPITGKPCPVPPNGFSRTPETLSEMQKDGIIIFGADETVQPRYKIFLTSDTKKQLTSVVQDAIKGTSDLHKFDISFPYCHSVSFYSKIISPILEHKDLILDFFAGSGTTAHTVIKFNRENNTDNKYILVEMGDYFDRVTKPRIQKVIYSEDWNNGKPVSRKGSSHCFKYMRLEQYEDTLNNLVVKKNTLMDQEGEFFDGYMLGYLLDTETKDSLFSLDWFVNPWNTKLKITRNNETKEEKIDLVETFNYLIGLKVQRISYPKSDICVVEGYNRKEEHILIIWRDCTKVSNEDLNEFFRRMAYSTRDKEFDKIYVNGDNNLENLKTDADTWKVTLIEQEFSKRMFEAE